MPVDRVYEDSGFIHREGVPVSYTNEARTWWIQFTSGGRRPATPTEVELWEMVRSLQRQVASFNTVEGDS